MHLTASEGRLPLSGPVSITVATEGPAETGHLQPSIEKWLRWLEEYLETPLPTANVLVHYGHGLPSPATGGNVGVSIIHPPGYAAPSEFHWTQHELVHYWFVGNEGWIDEGLAQALTSLIGPDPGKSMLKGDVFAELPIIQDTWSKGKVRAEEVGDGRRHGISDDLDVLAAQKAFHGNSLAGTKWKQD